MVFNKIDAFEYEPKDEDDLTPKQKENYSLEELKQTWMNKENQPSIFISAKNKINIDSLKSVLYEKVKKVHVTRFPYNDFLY
jgi:GTP-binding protein HflX